MAGSLHYLAVEGVIGAGKTALAKNLADHFDARTALEKIEENPFLEKYYRDPVAHRFQTQIYFLITRYQALQRLVEMDLFHSMVVTDYTFSKDKIYAYLNLDDDELMLYERLLPIMEQVVPKPDLVVYLQASTNVLQARIEEKGRQFERQMNIEYLDRLNEAYNYFFFHYSDTPLLVVNMDNVDFEQSSDEFLGLTRQIENPPHGTSYYVPGRSG